MDDSIFSEPLAAEPSFESGLDGTSGRGEDPSLPGDKGCEPPPAAAEAHGGDPSTVVSVEFSSKIVSADHLAIAGQIFNQQFTVSAGGEAIELSARHFASRTARELEACAEELVFEAREIEALRSSFEETRFLILAGEPEGGKGSLGLLLGARLIRTLQGKGMLTCQRLGSSVQVDLEKVAGDEAFGHQVVMFEDALAGENSDLRAFLRTVDPLCLKTLRERLRNNSAAILLTASSASLADCERRLESLGILRIIAPPAPDLLVQALRRFAARLPQQGARGEAVDSFLNDRQADLARELRTVPRIARFAHEYLAEVAAGNLPLHQALGRMDDLSQWLTADLAGDLDAQAAVLALVLGSAVPPAAGMPWFAFDDLRRRITELLRRELRLPEEQPSSPAELGRSFLDRARAYVATMPSPLPALVRFRDDRYAQRLWEALVGPARELATLMIPLLRELTLATTAPFLRASAAGALGRLGQIGPTDLAQPFLQLWARQAPPRDDLPGLFLQGSAGSEDKTYRNFCLTTLRDLAFGNNAAVAAVAVRSLGCLGLPDPEVPIRELCGIAQERLPIQIDVLRRVEKEIAEEEIQRRRAGDPQRVAAGLRALHEKSHTLLVGGLVTQDRIRLLGAVQYALAGVLFSQGGDPGPVLCRLTARMKGEPVRLAPLFAYLFLHRQGLIDLLDRYEWRSGAFGTETSRFLLSSRPGERDPEALRELLERIFSALEAFPGFFRSLLEERFFAVLTSWSREGCEVDGLRPTVVRLLSALRAAQNVALRRRMERFLETAPELTVRGSRLRALARDVLDGRSPEAVPAASPRPQRLPAWMGKRGGEGA
jgi:hypothetical protein